jgi:hypothetical protein
MKKLLCLSALIIYTLAACCPSSATEPGTPIAEPATVLYDPTGREVDRK